MNGPLLAALAATRVGTLAEFLQDPLTGLGSLLTLRRDLEVLVEREDEGFEIAPHEDKLGWRGTNTGPISFNNVRLEDDDVLGNILTGGFSHRAANHANLLAHVATSIGCAQGLFDKTLDYVQQRNLIVDDTPEAVTIWP